MIPLAGPVREGVGLLGSPCFEIPRSVQRDTRSTSSAPSRNAAAASSPRPGTTLVTIALHLLVRFALLRRWLLVVALLPVQRPPAGRRWASTTGLIFADLAVLHRPVRARRSRCHRVPPAAAAVLLDLPAAVLAARALLEGAVDRLPADLRRHPVQAAFWRLLGVRMGRRVFDDGCAIIERSLTSVGSGATLNTGLPAPVPLARGRHLHLRPHQHRVGLHRRHRRLRPLRGDDGRRRAGRGRFIR